MLAWERRLRDLSKLLENCGETYFSPDLFRQNTNQFLQTSRTVTFIIQKNKADIPKYEKWYSDNVLAPWKSDKLMTWAKDARNVIEKEGDLEMYSFLSTSVIFSHLPEQDLIIEAPKQFLVQADIDKIAKLAKSVLPPGVLDAAVLQIERRWVVNSLPEHELISALTYIYSNIFHLCFDLAKHLGGELDESIPHPTELDPASNDVAITRFIKLGKPNVSRFKSVRVQAEAKFEPPPELRDLAREFASLPKARSLDDLIMRNEQMAVLTFNRFGNHVPMLFLFNRDWKCVDFMSPNFADQSDKFLFWRNAAKRAAYLKATAFVFISETWIREIDERLQVPVRELKITGERLQLVAGSVDENTRITDWTITRIENPESVVLEKEISEEHKNAKIYFVEPLLSSMKAAQGVAEKK